MEKTNGGSDDDGHLGEVVGSSTEPEEDDRNLVEEYHERANGKWSGLEFVHELLAGKQCDVVGMSYSDEGLAQLE